jgi:hypothetical protein
MTTRTWMSFGVVLWLSAACLEIPEIEPVGTGGSPDAGPPDAGPPDAGQQDAGQQTEEPPPDSGVPVTLEVRLTQPVQTVHTRETVSLVVSVQGGVPDTVEVLEGTRVLATLTAPYTYTWDTRLEAEGTYAVSARATLGGRSFGSPAVTVVVDRTAPTVVSRSPAPGASGVVLRGLSIEAVFSEPLRASTVAAGSVEVTAAQQPVAVTPSLSADGRTLRLLLGEKPALPATLGVKLGSGLTDLAGNPVAAAGAWSFSLPEWLAMPSPQSAPGLTQRPFPSLALDENGRPIMAWTESINGAAGDVRVRRWNGMAWEDMGGALSGLPGSTRTEMTALAADRSGEVVVSWAERVDNADHFNIYVRRWTGMTWEPLEGGLVANAKLGQPHVVIDEGGGLYVAYGQWDIGSVYVYKWSGTVWQRIGTYTGSLVSFVLNPSAEPTLSLRTGSSSRAIEVNRLAGGVSWQPMGARLQPAPDASAVYVSNLAVQGADTGIAWIEETIKSTGGSDFRMLVWHWTGTEWQQVGTTLSLGRASLRAPVLGLDGDGLPFLSWSELQADNHLRVCYGRWREGAWQPVKCLDGNPAPGTPAHEERGIVFGADGTAFMAWVEGHGTSDNRMDLYLYQYNN